MERRPDRFTAFIDANALVPVRQRDLILSLAEAEFFRLRWSAQVLDEFTRALLKVYPAMTAERARTQRARMQEAFEDAMVDGHEALIPAFAHGPDPADAHVMAAAKQCDAAVIVTSNLKDFPQAMLAPFRIGVVTPDDFIADAIDLDQERAVKAVRRLRERLRDPALDAAALIAQLRRLGLTQTADLLEPHAADL